MALLPVTEARALILAEAGPVSSERADLLQAAGRVLAEPVVALRTQPPFDASAMDGYAVRAADIERVPARLKIIGTAPAGRPFAGAAGPGETVRIFTGAPLPAGSDTVLIQEDARVLDDGWIEAMEATARGRNVRRRGLDFAEGDVLLPAGRPLDPAALSLMAAANHPSAPVWKRPLVAILATGDELLAPGGETGPGQIISSNAYGVAAIVEAHGGRVLDLGIAADRQDAISAAIGRARAAQADILVTLGGASVGDHDLVRAALTGLGMRLDFWKIAMRPGKPLMFGRFSDMRALGLPGNPVASLICSHLFLAPLVAALAGRDHRLDWRSGVLGAPMAANDQREDYVRATVAEERGGLVATPFPVQDSSMLRTLADAQALIVRAPHAPPAEQGAPCRLLMLR